MGNRRLADSMSTKLGPENNVIWELGVTELNLWQICHRFINLWRICHRFPICVNMIVNMFSICYKLAVDALTEFNEVLQGRFIFTSNM